MCARSAECWLPRSVPEGLQTCVAFCVHRMCVFIQNQDVIKQTEGMLSVLSNSTAQAAKYMHDIQADLARRNAEVEAIGITLSQVRHAGRFEMCRDPQPEGSATA